MINIIIETIKSGKILSTEQSAEAIGSMLSSDATAEEMQEFLTLLADRGETPDEIAGAAQALRKHVNGITAPINAIDCCGTGGDGAHTLNISTAVAFVLAGCGVPVAKHGNRASSSKCGAADVLEAIGIKLDVENEKLEQALEKIGYCFLMAPLHHKAMAHVGPVRKSMGRRTIFNLLGPLANPASVRRQITGVYAKEWAKPMAEALKTLGCEGAWVVHGDGIDEVTLSGITTIAKLDDRGNIEETTVTPDDFGLNRINPEDLKGGDADFNATALLSLLNGEKNAYRDTVLANASSALVMTGHVATLKDGVTKAAASIDRGNALGIMKRYRDFVA